MVRRRTTTKPLNYHKNTKYLSRNGHVHTLCAQRCQILYTTRISIASKSRSTTWNKEKKKKVEEEEEQVSGNMFLISEVDEVGMQIFSFFHLHFDFGNGWFDFWDRVAMKLASLRMWINPLIIVPLCRFRSNCFLNEYFSGCVQALLLEEEMEKFSKYQQILGKK